MRVTPLKIDDYIGAHRVIRAVLASRGEKPATSCFFFALAGAQILRSHFGLDAAIFAGSFRLCAGPTKDWVMTFGHWDGGELKSHSSAFHAWIECGGYLIDLMAPVLNLARNDSGAGFDVVRRVFQKPISLMATGPAMVERSGEFWRRSDHELTRTLLDAYRGSKVVSHWVAVCSRWFRPSPGRIARTLDANDMQGKVVQTRLDEEPVFGQW